MSHLKKILVTGFVLVALFIQANAQCEDSDNFDHWIVVNDLLEEDGLTADTTVSLPNNWVSLLRPFSLSFSAAFGLPADSFDLVRNYFGLQQESVDNSTTDFAMCMTPDRFANVSDALSFFFCEDEPNSITLNLRHTGMNTDTLQVIYFQRQEGVLDDLLIGFDDPATSGFTAFGSGLLVGGSNQYQDITLQVERYPNAPDDAMTPDTAVVWLIASSGSEDSLAITTTYCINNLQLNYEVTPTTDVNTTVLTLSPNPATTFLSIYMEAGKQKDLLVFDIAGQIIYQNTILSTHEIDVNNWPVGLYTVQIRDDQNVTTGKFIKN